MSILKRGLLLGAAFAFFNTVADAQDQVRSMDDLFSQVATPAPSYASAASSARLGDSESAALRAALASARRGDSSGYSAAYSSISNPDARKIATWAMVDVNGERLSFFELDQARRDLAGWPRGPRRQTLTEQKLETSGMSAQGIIDWFAGDAPTTGEGAMALAGAYLLSGREAEAISLIRSTWRSQVFEAAPQRDFLARFGGYLTAEDHAKRADLLLYGQQGPATRDVVSLLTGPTRTAAEARLALRSGASPDVSYLMSDPGVAFERMSQLSRQGQIQGALAAARYLGPAPGFEDGDARVYSERRQLFVEALKIQDYEGAYASMKDAGFASGERKAESDFFAGWVALRKLNRPAEAVRYFEGVRQAGRTPLTQGRAYYWLGRAAEAQGQTQDAQAYYREGGQYIGAFYGQLAAERAGITQLVLPPEPQPSANDRARFEGRETVRAARILAEVGEQTLFKAFVQQIDDDLPNAEEYALMMDMARQYNEPFLAMMAGRAAAGKGFILPERMYPVRMIPDVPGAPDPAFVLAITRQESSFDPAIRSSADARGMMMLLPSTAQLVARRLGVPYQASQLYNEEYNMRLGTYHLGELVSAQSGSFILTAVGYNAGPSRISQWTSYCGDPRGLTEPTDFIECAPFTETRNYMMRVMENVQIYRARLNNGVVTPTPSADLKRGGYNYASTSQAPQN